MHMNSISFSLPSLEDVQDFLESIYDGKCFDHLEIILSKDSTSLFIAP